MSAMFLIALPLCPQETATMQYHWAQSLHSLQGVAINFVREDDVRVLRDIEQYYSTQIDEMVSPLC